jgi:hypothetical protein
MQRRTPWYRPISRLAFCLAAALFAPAAVAKAPTPKEQKINAYVQIINGESNHVFETRKNYAAGSRA